MSATLDFDLTEAQHERLAAALTPKVTPYNAAEPISIKQQAALLLPQSEALYGGAAGGGKSSWGLHAAAQYVDIPGYSAVIFRRTYGQLSEAGAIMDRSLLWWGQTDAHWNDGKKRWTFPCPGGGYARIAFRHLDNVNDWMKYQGPEYQFVFFDELTQFTEKQYTYLFSRLRKPKPPSQWDPARWAKLPPRQQQIVHRLSSVPLRMRAASNPGGPGHDWVRHHFGIYHPDGDSDPRRLCERPEWINQNDRIFLPAKVRDNPGLDIDEYIKALQHLDPHTLAQYLDGDWDAKEPGAYFRREWFQILDIAPKVDSTVRYWDFAATEAAPGTDPDWTVGLKMARRADGQGWVVLDVQRFRRRSFEVEELVKQAAYIDSPRVVQHIEQEGGASGKSLINHYQRNVLTRFAVRGDTPSGDKTTRARPVAAKAEAGMVSLVRAPWNQAFLDELEGFPDGNHDDQVDAFSGAFIALEGRARWVPAPNASSHA